MERNAKNARSNQSFQHCYRPHPKHGDSNVFSLSTPGGGGGGTPRYLPPLLAKVPTHPPPARSGWGVAQGTYPLARSGWGEGYPKVPNPLAKVPTPGQVRTGVKGTPRYLLPPAKVPTPPPPQRGQDRGKGVPQGTYPPPPPAKVPP